MLMVMAIGTIHKVCVCVLDCIRGYIKIKKKNLHYVMY